MRNWIALLVVMSASLSWALGQKEGGENDLLPWVKGMCKNEIQTLQPNFDPYRFSGVWYEQQSMGTMFVQFNRKCISVNSTYLGNNTFTVTLNEYIPIVYARVTKDILVTLEDIQKPTFNFTIKIGPLSLNTPISILSTDYDNYALLYSCSSEPEGRAGYISEMAFVLRRKRGDKSKANYIRQQIWNQGLRIEDFKQEDITCPTGA